MTTITSILLPWATFHDAAKINGLATNVLLARLPVNITAVEQRSRILDTKLYVEFYMSLQ